MLSSGMDTVGKGPRIGVEPGERHQEESIQGAHKMCAVRNTHMIPEHKGHGLDESWL